MYKKVTVLVFLITAIIAATTHVGAFAMPDPNLRVTDITATYATVSWDNLNLHGTDVYYQVELGNTVINYPGDFSTRVPHGGSPGSSVTFTIGVYDGGDNSVIASDSVTVTIPAKKTTTVSISGSTTINSGGLVRLSTTVNGDDVSRATYQWTQTSGPSNVYPDRTRSTLEFIAPDVTANTSYSFKVTVTDAGGSTATDTVTVTVAPMPNSGPTANAGADQTVSEDGYVTLDGRGSTDDKSGITYEWSQVGTKTVTINDSTSSIAGFEAPDVDSTTVLTIMLTVTDKDGATDTDTVKITVTAIANKPPYAFAGEYRIASVSDTVTLSGIASDIDGHIASYAWTRVSGPSVTLANANSATATFTVPESASNKVFKFRLTVTDDNGATASDVVTIAVPSGNAELVADAEGPSSVVDGERVQLNATGTKYNGTNTLTYTWKKVHGPDSIPDYGPYKVPNTLTGATPSFTVPKFNSTYAGLITVGYLLTVSDGVLEDTDHLYLTINPNIPPAAFADAHTNNEKQVVNKEDGLSRTARAGEVVTLVGSGFDIDSSTLTYSWSTTRGPSVTLTGTGPERTFAAPSVSTPTVMEFKLVVRDNVGATGEATVKVEVHPNNRPTVNAGVDQMKRPEQHVTLRGTGADSDDDPLTYSWRQVSGPTVTTSSYDQNRRITFTTPNATSALVFEFTASDGLLKSSDRVTVRVQSNDYMPIANAGRDRTVNSNTTVTIRGTGSDAQNDPLTYLWKHVSGPGVELVNKNTPTVQFTSPTVFETKQIVLNFTVSDDKYSVTDSVTITVRPPTGIPVANAGPDVSSREQGTVTLRGSATDRDTPSSRLTYTWSHDSNLDIDIDDRNSRSTSVTLPAVNSNTTVTFTLTVSDGTYTDSDTMTVTIRDNKHHSVPPGVLYVYTTGGNVTTINLPVTNPDGDALTAEWSNLRITENFGDRYNDTLNAALAAETGLSFTLTPPVTEHGGVIMLLVKITDGLHEERIVITVIAIER